MTEEIARVSGLKIFPVKGLAGINLISTRVEERGFQHDRRWMIVDETSKFISQRQHPGMAAIQTSFTSDQLVLKKGNQELRTPLFPTGDRPRKDVVIWRDEVAALVIEEAAEWLAEILGFKSDLVYLPPDSARQIDLSYAEPGQNVSFADGFPILVITENSMADLNGRLPVPLPIDRFRPNLIVDGPSAYAEDHWSKFRVGSTRLRGVKPCSRCAVPTVDQRTGVVTGPEPIKTLGSYRRYSGKIYFGQNVLVLSEGLISLGDEVIVEERAVPVL